MPDTPRKRGRPALYLDNVDRQAAYRERQNNEAALGAAARRIVEKPTPTQVAKLAARTVGQAADPAATAQALVLAVLTELERTYGHNIAQAARNALE